MLSATVLLARTRGDAGALAVAVQRELRRIDPDVVFWPGLTMRDNVATQLLPVRLLSAMLGTAGLVAVWLAALGLYGVIAHAVVRRTREIGIRMALGATPRDVLRLVVRQGAVPVGVGAAAGVALAFGGGPRHRRRAVRHRRDGSVGLGRGGRHAGGGRCAGPRRAGAASRAGGPGGGVALGVRWRGARLGGQHHEQVGSACFPDAAPGEPVACYGPAGRRVNWYR